MQHDRTHRAQIQLVGIGRQVILLLIEIISKCIYLLTAAAKALKGRSNRLKFADAGTSHFPEIKDQHFDALIVFGKIDDINNIF